jgi:PAS domain S-box-containing protein
MKKTYLKSKEVLFDGKIQKLQWIVKVRYVAPIVIWVAVVLSNIQDLFSSAYFWIYTPITVLFLLVNIGIDFYLRKIKSLPAEKKSSVNLNHSVLIQTLFDIILFTILIYFDGGVESHVILMFIIVLLVNGFLADKIYGYITAAIISFMYALILLGELYGFIEHIFLRGEHIDYYLNAQQVYSELVYVAVMFFLIVYFIHYLATESKDLEKELDRVLVENEKINEQYRDITDNAFDFIQSIDKYGSFVYTNKIWKERLGYTEEDLKKVKVFDVVAEKDLLTYRQAVKQLRNTRKNQHFRITLVSKKGDEIIVDATLSARFNDKGEIISTREIFRDVTKRVKLEQEARLRTSDLEALNESMVGREMKMIELQEKVSQLEEKLKQEREKNQD